MCMRLVVCPALALRIFFTIFIKFRYLQHIVGLKVFERSLHMLLINLNLFLQIYHGLETSIIKTQQFVSPYFIQID